MILLNFLYDSASLADNQNHASLSSKRMCKEARIRRDEIDKKQIRDRNNENRLRFFQVASLI